MNYKVKKALFYIFIFGVGFMFIIPLMYLTTTSLTSRVEINDFPRPMFPSLSHETQWEWDEANNRYTFYWENNSEEYIPLNYGDPEYLSEYLDAYLNVSITPDELEDKIESARLDGEIVDVRLSKSLFRNYGKFFDVFSGAEDAFVNSVKAAVYTIILSLSIGGSLGFAIARTNIKGKDAIGIGALIVRMFPTIAISVSAAVLLINFGLFDSMFGLAIVYSIPNIGLTAWITRGIFMGVNKELEEASLVFGASKLQTFYKITLPLVLPAFAASSMYAFITAWNDTGVALLLTNKNETLSLLLYSSIGGAGSVQYAAAGSLLLIIPALVFTFFLRKYINQLWG
ncbi:MAG: Trehalose transport system permease protein SugB [Candidatus Izimaplasma bacterium HR2]|nr:MAG: Trehalose transport system permease protein SugB [Candidatus Izimaplasma bacterium HR2]